MRSKAVLFGINYLRCDNNVRLKGCINDSRNMGSFLESKGYNVEIVTDLVSDDGVTRDGIMSKLKSLVLESKREKYDKVWIHFSGHGCRLRDTSGDEIDGYDECLLPVDYELNGVITDDEIKRILDDFDDIEVVVIMDCCHSGTICDLQYKNGVMIRPSYNSKNSRILCISGCNDRQTSADAFNVRGKYSYTGAMTSCLLKVLETKRTVFEVVDCLRDELRSKGFTQVPQLTSSFKVDYNHNLL